MSKIYSYVLRYDDGGAPNPFWGLCTLAICKPAIRRTAQIGDWIIGTGSANTEIESHLRINLSDCIVYAMKVTDILTLEQYNDYCILNLPEKLPDWYNSEWPIKMGDCIYHNFLNQPAPDIRKSVHNAGNLDTDLSGKNVLMSNHFYYFGLAAKALPPDLRCLIKQNQGHKITNTQVVIDRFEKWISEFQLNTLYADPQLRWKFDRELSETEVANCAKEYCKEDENQSEEYHC